MEEQGILELGSFADNLLADSNFQILSASFEQSCIAELLATQPAERAKREYIYTKTQAHREFLTHLVEYVKMKNEAIKPIEIEPEVLDPNGLEYRE